MYVSIYVSMYSDHKLLRDKFFQRIHTKVCIESNIHVFFSFLGFFFFIKWLISFRGLFNAKAIFVEEQ